MADQSWCHYCEAMTDEDGWGMGLDGNSVDIYCDGCGKQKATIAYEDAPAGLQDLIRVLTNARTITSNRGG